MGTSNGPNTFLAGTAAGHGAPSGITGSLVSLAPARCSASPGSPLASQTEKVDHLTLRAIAPGCSHANVEKSSHHHSRTSSISSIAAIAPICAALLRDCRNSSITVAPRQSRRLPRQSQSHFVNLVDCRVIQFHPTSAPRACSASSAWTTRTRASSCPCRPSSSSSSRPPPRARAWGARARPPWP